MSSNRVHLLTRINFYSIFFHIFIPGWRQRKSLDMQRAERHGPAVLYSHLLRGTGIAVGIADEVNLFVSLKIYIKLHYKQSNSACRGTKRAELLTLSCLTRLISAPEHHLVHRSPYCRQCLHRFRTGTRSRWQRMYGVNYSSGPV